MSVANQLAPAAVDEDTEVVDIDNVEVECVFSVKALVPTRKTNAVVNMDRFRGCILWKHLSSQKMYK